MVRVRRAVTEEKDRYGGYMPRVDTERDREPVEVDLNVDPDVELSFSRRTPAETPVRESRRSPYSQADYAKTQYAGKVAAPTRRKRTVPREPEDIMPSIKTQAYMTEKPQEIEQPVERKEKQSKPLLSAKSKALLLVYVAAVVLLAVVVIATGLSLSASTARVTALEEAVANRNAVIAQQMNELSNLENQSTLTGMATELGMQKADVATEIELLPVAETVEYAPRTNWFDRFCDWLSNII